MALVSAMRVYLEWNSLNLEESGSRHDIYINPSNGKKTDSSGKCQGTVMDKIQREFEKGCRIPSGCGGASPTSFLKGPFVARRRSG